MPSYEFECKACKHNFTLVMSVAEHEKKKVPCPECKSRKVSRLLSVFSAKTSRKS